MSQETKCLGFKQKIKCMFGRHVCGWDGIVFHWYSRRHYFDCECCGKRVWEKRS